MFLTLLLGCETKPDEAQTPQFTHFQGVLLLDKSASLRYDSAHVRRVLSQCLVGNLADVHDRIWVFEVNAQTANSHELGHLETFGIDADNRIRGNMAGKGQNNIKKAIRAAKPKRDSIHSIFQEALQALAMAPYNRADAMRSHIAASLLQLQKILDQPKPEGIDDQKFRVLFLSDMLEDSDLRNFERTPPQDATQAQAWAREDLEKLDQKYGLQRKLFENVEVYYAMPSQDKVPNKALVEPYWRAFFGELGASFREFQ
jgi:hypothetical protein